VAVSGGGHGRILPASAVGAASCCLHLYALDRGILLTFHNMALMSPSTTAADVEAHAPMFGACLRELVA
jgi:hypothetical protein